MTGRDHSFQLVDGFALVGCGTHFKRPNLGTFVGGANELVWIIGGDETERGYYTVVLACGCLTAEATTMVLVYASAYFARVCVYNHHRVCDSVRVVGGSLVIACSRHDR